MFCPLSICNWRSPPPHTQAELCAVPSVWLPSQGDQFGVRWALTAVTPCCASPLKKDSVGKGAGRSQSPSGCPGIPGRGSGRPASQEVPSRHGSPGSRNPTCPVHLLDRWPWRQFYSPCHTRHCHQSPDYGAEGRKPL